MNLCDEGLEQRPVQGAACSRTPRRCWACPIPAPAAPALAACYDKGVVRAVAASLDVPVPLETYVRPGDQGATLPSVFPAILKPNYGDSSQGITKDAVVRNQSALIDYLERLRTEFPRRPVLVQEYLHRRRVLAWASSAIRTRACARCRSSRSIISRLDPKLPKILGYESKWEPESPYWTQIKYHEAQLSDYVQSQMIEYSARLFERLGCRDYARFDFRADAKGEIKLLEVNPNPGWCWDGKLNIMAGFAGIRYSELLGQILAAAEERLGIVAKPQAAIAANGAAVNGTGASPQTGQPLGQPAETG